VCKGLTDAALAPLADPAVLRGLADPAVLPSSRPSSSTTSVSPAPAASPLSRLTRVSLRMCLSLTAVKLTAALPALLTLDLVGRCRLTVSKPELKASMVSALDT
jgi:hypothetical protein